LIVVLAWVAGRRCERRRIGTIFSENRLKSRAETHIN
jgi:hypothetical protein